MENPPHRLMWGLILTYTTLGVPHYIDLTIFNRSQTPILIIKAPIVADGQGTTVPRAEAVARSCPEAFRAIARISAGCWL